MPWRNGTLKWKPAAPGPPERPDVGMTMPPHSMIFFWHHHYSGSSCAQGLQLANASFAEAGHCNSNRTTHRASDEDSHNNDSVVCNAAYCTMNTRLSSQKQMITKKKFSGMLCG
eukprot:scaffold209073_cov21-Prasinocladus_malaysianus.AAC.3